MNNKLKSKLIPVCLTLLVIALDQLTKFFVVKYIPLFSVFADDAIIEVFGKYLRIIHVRNNAIAFSLGTNLSQSLRSILFGLFPLGIIIAVFSVYFRNNDFTKLQRWAICGILGGGLGNLIDRFFRPLGVVDFIDVYFFGIAGMERWPTFNVADSAVVVYGIIFLITFGKQIYCDTRKK